MFLAAGPAAAADASAWVENPHAWLRLIAAAPTVGAEDGIALGLQFRLDEGWKIYWRTPGDAGYPPVVDWSGSTNLAAARVDWPAPSRSLEEGGLVTYGYKGDVVLPVAATLARAGAPLALRARVDYMVCETICIPFTAALALEVPAGPAASGRHAGTIQAALLRVPLPEAVGPIRIAAVAATGYGGRQTLEVVAETATPSLLNQPDLFIEGPPTFQFGTPLARLVDGGRRAEFRVPVTAQPGAPALGATPLTLTLVDGARAIEAVRVPAVAPGGAGVPWAILAIALLGGLILNLMPCVLPVLSLKLLGVITYGGAARGRIRLAFLTSAAGIVASFLLLAGGTILLQAGGIAVGWGMQFQAPVFLAAMTLVLVLFAANLFGRFEIPLPRAFAALAEGEPRRGLAGDFLTGAFATLLATPCSAPFLGTALGFALSRGAGEIILVFLALGLGMALPYLAVAAAPALVARLPRPGPWMRWLRAGLGLLLVGTALWLLWVLGRQLGPWVGVAGGLAALVVLGSLALPPAAQRVRQAGAAVGALALLAVALVPTAHAPAAPERSGGIAWQPFAPALIGEAVAQGRVVFVDVTADWCVTCLVNKKLVVKDAQVRARLNAPHVLALQADWTQPNAAIGAYLAGFGRYGIPFNVVYGEAAPQGIVLPEVLTRDAVLAALERAGGRVAGRSP